MSGKLATMLLFLGLGCAGGGAAGEPRTAAGGEPARAETPPAAPSAGAAADPELGAMPPKTALKEADRLYDNQLALGRDDRFLVDRQVTELRRAILLYEQFIERAGDSPELASAVRKSRERIEDAQRTIDFLVESAASGER